MKWKNVCKVIKVKVFFFNIFNKQIKFVIKVLGRNDWYFYYIF